MATKTEIYKQTYKDDDFPGLEAIMLKEREVYGEQEPTHWATEIPVEMGGQDPLWAVDCFVSHKQSEHFHFVTLGFTNLYYDSELAESEKSGFGFELTFRHLPVKDDLEKPIWPAGFLQNIAKYVFSTSNVFDDYHFMSANGPILQDTDTQITAFAFITDPEMQIIDSPNGTIKFLQVFGITTIEYNNLKEKKYSVKDLIDKHALNNPLLITDLSRK